MVKAKAKFLMTIIILFRFVIGTEIALARISTPLTQEFKFYSKSPRKLALNFHFKFQIQKSKKQAKQARRTLLISLKAAIPSKFDHFYPTFYQID